MRVERLARGLGWFSIGLGAFELFGGRRLARLLGREERLGLFRFFGLREIGTGLGIFFGGRRKPWLAGRVAGDALDLAFLAGGLFKPSARKGATAFALANVAAVTALDVLAARRLPS